MPGAITCPACTFAATDDPRGKTAYCPRCGVDLPPTGAGVAGVDETRPARPAVRPRQKAWLAASAALGLLLLAGGLAFHVAHDRRHAAGRPRDDPIVPLDVAGEPTGQQQTDVADPQPASLLETYRDEAPPKEVTNALGMKLMLVPAGKFLMGSPKDEIGRRDDETQHEVEITRPFYVGATEVTQAQYRKLLKAEMDHNPPFFSPGNSWVQEKFGKIDTDDFPVENVSWAEAVEFCKRLTALEKDSGRVYRLPTEAEWEYACRGGSKEYQTFHFGDSLSSDKANVDGERPYGRAWKEPNLGRTCKVGSYRPNAFGLHDMHGNAWEWCSDWYAADYYANSPKQDPQGPASSPVDRRVVRGGSFQFHALNARSAARYYGIDGGDTARNTNGSAFVGFRVVMEQKPQTRSR
jgi:formylglycine-generating enzyme required for sulfatase activity